MQRQTNTQTNRDRHTNRQTDIQRRAVKPFSDLNVLSAVQSPKRGRCSDASEQTGKITSF